MNKQITQIANNNRWTTKCTQIGVGMMHAPNSNENNWKIKPGSRKSVQTDKRAIVQYVSSVDDALPNAPPKPKSLKTKYHSKNYDSLSSESTSTANSSVVQRGSDEDWRQHILLQTQSRSGAKISFYVSQWPSEENISHWESYCTKGKPLKIYSV